MKTLKNKISIYIPSRSGDTEINQAFRERVIRNTEGLFSETFGGATTIKGNGCWVDSNGYIVNEPVDIVTSYAENLRNSRKIYDYARALKQQLKQDAIMLEVNNHAKII